VVIGHPKSDDPAYGWVRGLRFADGALKATLHKVAPAFAAMVQDGAFRNRSASFYSPEAPNNPRPGHWYLRHVGFLGALAPAVKGLQPVAYADNERGAVTVEFAERDPRDAELARLRQENTHLKRAGASADHATFVDRLIDSGRLLPCFADGVRQALDIALLQDEGTVSFGEGDEARSLNLHDFLKTFLESQPPIVQFGEVAGPTGLDGTAATMTAHADRIAQWVEEERRKGRAVSFSDAPAHLFLTR